MRLTIVFGVYPSYYLATKIAYDSDVQAAILIDTEDQIWEHLYGHGYVAPDEDPDDNVYYWAKWRC